jgi:hypothetical protein
MAQVGLAINHFTLDDATCTAMLACACQSCKERNDTCSCSNKVYHCDCLDTDAGTLRLETDTANTNVKIFRPDGLPYGVLVHDANTRTICYKFSYDENTVKSMRSITSIMYHCRNAEHVQQYMTPFLCSMQPPPPKVESDLYAISLRLSNTNLDIDVEHSELKQVCHLIKNKPTVGNMMVARNDQLSVYFESKGNEIKYNVYNAAETLLVTSTHDWSPFSDIVQVTKQPVDGVQGMMQLVQQNTRMLHSTCMLTSEHEHMYDMYHTCRDKLQLAVSIIHSMKLVSNSTTHEGMGKESVSRKWVRECCDVTQGTVSPTNRPTPTASPSGIEHKNKITCSFSSSIRYDIAHKNKAITNLLQSPQYGMNIEQITAILLGGIGSTSSSSIPSHGFETPCKQAFVTNATDFPYATDAHLEKQRMNACRHSMGTNANTFKIVQSYVDWDVYVHVCNDGGSCVFSRYSDRNIVSVHLTSANNTTETQRPWRPGRFSTKIQTTQGGNNMMQFRCALDEVQYQHRFSLRKAAIQLAHLNAACLQNPQTALQMEHRYLRSCWFTTQMQTLALQFPDTVSDVQYCTIAAKLSNMAKTSLDSTNFWYMVPYCCD